MFTSISKLRVGVSIALDGEPHARPVHNDRTIHADSASYAGAEPAVRYRLVHRFSYLSGVDGAAVEDALDGGTLGFSCGCHDLPPLVRRLKNV